MARGGPRGCLLARERKISHLHPPLPVKSSHPWGRTRTSRIIIGPPRFFDLFFGPRPKVFEKHYVILYVLLVDRIDVVQNILLVCYRD